MSITLDTLMDMSVMQGAVVLAGKSNMQNTINTVSVYDHYSAELLADLRWQTPEYLMGELVLTGYMYRHSVSEQCACVRRLHEAGASGLVVFFVGLFTNQVEQAVIDTARELSFPLICMPPNRYLYSDLITDVMKAVLLEQDEKNHLMNMVFERMAKMDDRLRTMENLLRILSNYMHASIALYDNDRNILQSVCWPNARQGVFREAAFAGWPSALDVQASGGFTAADGVLIHYSLLRTTIKNADARYMAILSEYGPVDEKLFQPILDILRLYVNIWGKGNEAQSAGELVRAIVRNEVVKAQKLAQVLRVDLSRLEMMWLVSVGRDVTDEETGSYLQFTDQYLKQSRLRGIAALFGNYLVVFIETPSYQLDYKQITDVFIAEMPNKKAPLYFLFQQRLRNMQHVKEIYSLFAQYLDPARRIFPCRSIFSEQELIFTRQCIEILQKDKETIRRYLAPLEPLNSGQEWQRELSATLGVYLLDADGITETADRMFVHTSTVKYRLKRLSETLGYDVKKRPEANYLYQAVALMRLMPSKDDKAKRQ